MFGWWQREGPTPPPSAPRPPVLTPRDTNPNLEDIGESLCEDQAVRCVVALDIGTATTGFSYSFGSERIRMGHMAAEYEPGKGPTALLLNRDGSFRSFGWDALSESADLDDPEDNLLYQTFKMQLCESSLRDWQRTTGDEEPTGSASSMQRPAPGQKVKAANGCERFTLLHIFSTLIEHVKERALEAVRAEKPAVDEGKIHWVLTVPAIWKDRAKAFMRHCALQAKLIDKVESDRLHIVLEPECAAIASQAHTRVGDGQCFVLADCGGGTIDCTIHRQLRPAENQFRLIELDRPAGGPWGSKSVDMQFDQWMQDFLQKNDEQYGEFRRSSQHVDMMIDFEKKKIGLSQEATGLKDKLRFNLGAHVTQYFANNDVELDVPRLIEEYNVRKNLVGTKAALVKQGRCNVQLPQSLLETFFMPSIRSTCDEVKRLCTMGQRPQHVILAGGYGECKLLNLELQKMLSEQLPEGQRVELIKPDSCQASAAVLHGAVLFGQTPDIFIAVRKATLTYGTNICYRFDARNPKHVKAREEGKTKMIKPSGGGGQEELYVMGMFEPLVNINDELKADHEVEASHTPLYQDQTSVVYKIYGTSLSSDLVDFVDDPSVALLGTVPALPCKANDGHKCKIQLRFGGQEISCKAINKTTNDVVQLPIRYDQGFGER